MRRKRPRENLRMSRDKQRPQDRPSWDQRYADGELPWDSGKEDVHLGEVIERHGIEAGKALEIGCGTGTNTIWLAGRGSR